MKIVYIVESLSSFGGAENAVVNLALALKKRGHDVSIFYLNKPNHFVKILNNNKIEFFCIDLKYRWNILVGFFRLKKYLQKKKPQIVNAINFFPMFYLSLVSVGKKKYKSFVTYHNLGYDSFPAKSLYKKIRKKVDIFFNQKFIDAHISVSNAVAKSYKKHLKLKKIDTIYNIVQIKKLLQCYEKYQKQNKTPKLIMVGRLIREKGYNNIIEIFKILKQQKINCILNIYGDGILKEQIKKKIKVNRLSKYIFVNNSISQKYLFKQIRESNILLMPSTHEGLPMVMIEAMVLGTCVIAFNVGGISELIKNRHTGILVPANNIKKFSIETIKIIHNFNLQKKLSMNAQAKILNNFSEDILVKKTIDLYNKKLSLGCNYE